MGNKTRILLHCGSLVNEKDDLDGNGNSERVNQRGKSGLRQEKIILYFSSTGG